MADYSSDLEGCCGGIGDPPDSNCCGPFSLGVPGVGWSSCCDNVCPPPVCCCNSVSYAYDCGGFGNRGIDCVPVEPGEVCPPPCDGEDPPVDPSTEPPPSYEEPPLPSYEEADPGFMSPIEGRSKLSYDLDELPGIPDFTKSYKDSNNDFVFALETCSVPCTVANVTVSFSGCCLYVDGCNVTTVGSGTLTWNTPSISDCEITVTVNGDSSGSLFVEDGTSVSVSLSGDGSPCCTCQLKSQSGCGVAFDNSGLWTVRNGKLMLNKRKYMNQRNRLIRHRTEKKLRKLAGQRRNSLLNKIKKRK